MRRISALLVTLLPVSFLTIGPARAGEYWFETYERAASMVDHARYGEAAAALEDLIEAHPVPIVTLRVPGDRFLDYLPYYQLARIRLAVEDYQGAMRSLDMSESFEAVASDAGVRRSHAELRARIRALRAGEPLPPGATPAPASR